ncbi:U7 snRNA-associated Sm-like protein LSm11 [Chelonus insularis]|uniref:U7 snRNA-associated Sm-like protein LSm11 n=1 Tax=Chelonus insularis TaxID=460826 RepID=UPI00158D860B|nr:U7 snRNA-associated Sm-like protein LSm11 [Chelonus insularis]
MEDAESSSSDESLDVTNTSFDPLKFLYSEKTKIPVPSAPIYDNVSKFETKLKGIVTKPRAHSNVSNPHPASSQCTEEFDAFKNGKNVLSRMENILGPLQLLYNCVETKTRIKVYTRSIRGIRGYIEAYVTAFDKHWNLALEDCLETWTRKVKRKAPALGTAEKLEMIEENVPKMIVKKSNGKTETLERHVPQMMLRGEQVVIIIKMN